MHMLIVKDGKGHVMLGEFLFSNWLIWAGNKKLLWVNFYVNKEEDHKIKSRGIQRLALWPQEDWFLQQVAVVVVVTATANDYSMLCVSGTVLCTVHKCLIYSPQQPYEIDASIFPI